VADADCHCNWIWHHGGDYFGVPLVNFLGWYLTVYLFYQVFALYVRRLDTWRPKIPGYWIKPLLAYTSMIVAPSLDLLLNTQIGPVTDSAGAVWQIHDIRAVTTLVGLFTLLPFWLLAVFRSVVRSACRTSRKMTAVARILSR
jgi:putative membrane protein